VASDIKRNFNNEKDYSDKTDIQCVANFYNCSFVVYNNLFNILFTVKPKGLFEKTRKSSVLMNKEHKLQFRNGHCCLLIPRSQYPDWKCNQIVSPFKKMLEDA
jgi:hypothetical protein